MTDALTCSALRGSASSRGRVDERPRSPGSRSSSSGCQSTPSAKRLSGSSIASTTPSSADQPLTPGPPPAADSLVVVGLDGDARPGGARGERARLERAPRGRRRSRRVAVASAAVDVGQVLVSVPPRATFSSCMPRQMPSSGMSRSSARARSAISKRSRSGQVPWSPGAARRRSWPGRRRRRRPASAPSTRSSSTSGARAPPPRRAAAPARARRRAARAAHVVARRQRHLVAVPDPPGDALDRGADADRRALTRRRLTAARTRGSAPSR